MNKSDQTISLFPYGCRLPVRDTAGPYVMNNGRTLHYEDKEKEKSQRVKGKSLPNQNLQGLVTSRLETTTTTSGVGFFVDSTPTRAISDPAQPLFDPRGIERPDRKMREERCFELARERDEAHFWLNGYVNKQNCRIWSEANPQVYVETPLYPEKLTVWCALWAGGILLQKR
ncbi:hypothetical protein TNCV_447761 [Trichonephila clavipes]|nr:hypothetical protein TNCV_447761 [Trichonephila clavipes]